MTLRFETVAGAEAERMVTCKVSLPVPTALVAEISILNTPVSVGVPEIVSPVKLKPAGNVPTAPKVVGPFVARMT